MRINVSFVQVVNMTPKVPKKLSKTKYIETIPGNGVGLTSGIDHGTSWQKISGFATILILFAKYLMM